MPNCTDEPRNDREITEFCKFWIEGVIVVLIALFGLLANSVSLYILSKLPKNTFNQLLIALVSVDSLIVVFATIDTSLVPVFEWPLHQDNWFYISAARYLLYPGNNILLCFGIYLTVAIAVERYFAVCCPVTYREIQLTYSTFARICWYVGPSALLGILVNIPRYFETEVLDFQGRNMTADEDDLVVYKDEGAEVALMLSKIRTDPQYVMYYVNYTRLILTGLIPMVLLTFLNYKIIQGLRSSPAASRRAGSESRQALTLVVIAWIFLICHTPRILLNLVENLQMEHFYNCQGEMKVPAWFHCLTGLNHLLLILNSSINFLIYCVCGTRFRKELSMLCRLSFLLQRGAVHEVVELCNNNNNSPALTSAVERYPTTAVSTRGTPITAVSTRGAPTTAVSTRGAPTTAVPTRGTPTTAVSTRGTPTTAVSTSGTPNTTVSGRNLMTTTV